MLWVRSLATGDASPLAGTDGASFPFWSPDSRSIGFFANDRLYRIGVDGGSLQRAGLGAGRDGRHLEPRGRDSVHARAGRADLRSLRRRWRARRLRCRRDARTGRAGQPLSAVPAGWPSLSVFHGRSLPFAASMSERSTAPERRRLFDADAAAVFVPPASDPVPARRARCTLQRFDPATLTLDGEAVSGRTRRRRRQHRRDGGVRAQRPAPSSYRTGSANRQRHLAWFDRPGTQIGEAFPPDSDNPMQPGDLTRRPAGRAEPHGRRHRRHLASGPDADRRAHEVTSSPTPDISAGLVAGRTARSPTEKSGRTASASATMLDGRAMSRR